MSINSPLGYSRVVVFFLNPQLTFYNHEDNLLDMDGFICLDPHDHVVHLEHNTKLFIKLRYHQLRLCKHIETRDPSLWTNFLDYFNVEANT